MNLYLTQNLYNTKNKFQMDYEWKFLTFLETNVREHLSELEVKKNF